MSVISFHTYVILLMLKDKSYNSMYLFDFDVKVTVHLDKFL